jgi:hypothetical protein
MVIVSVNFPFAPLCDGLGVRYRDARNVFITAFRLTARKKLICTAHARTVHLRARMRAHARGGGIVSRVSAKEDNQMILRREGKQKCMDVQPCMMFVSAYERKKRV